MKFVFQDIDDHYTLVIDIPDFDNARQALKNINEFFSGAEHRLDYADCRLWGAGGDPDKDLYISDPTDDQRLAYAAGRMIFLSAINYNACNATALTVILNRVEGYPLNIHEHGIIIDQWDRESVDLDDISVEVMA